MTRNEYLTQYVTKRDTNGHDKNSKSDTKLECNSQKANILLSGVLALQKAVFFKVTEGKKQN